MGYGARWGKIYGSNSVMGMVEPELDRMSFYSWPTERLETKRYGAAAPLLVSGLERVDNPTLLAAAQTLVPELEEHTRLNPVSLSNTTVGWQAWDLWRVNFTGGEVPQGVGRTAMVQIDTIANSGTVLRNNLFTDTNCNLGRFKSSNSVIAGNTFRNAAIPSLELAWLPQFFEGPVLLSNVTLSGNNVEGEGPQPIHCGPGCGSQTCLYDQNDRPIRKWTAAGCPQCPDCFSSPGGATPWTNGIILRNNTITP